MDATEPGFWILPSRGRVHTQLPAFLKSAIGAGVSTPGFIVVNDAEYAAEQEAYDTLTLPDGWTICPVSADTAMAKTQQALRELMHDGARWVGWLADDVRPVTPGWDVKAIANLNGWNFCSTDDALYAPAKMNGAMVFSADLIRTVGWLFLPTVNHFYSDDAWQELGQATGCWTCDMQILVRHLHETKTGVKDSTSHKTNESWTHDDKAIIEWRKTEKADTIDRIFELMKTYGVDVFRPDLTGVEVMLAVPNGSGRYENLFVESLRRTEQYVKQYGGEFRFMEMSYCSDIYIARARIIGGFMRSTATHLFMIDDDQAWDPMDFVKFLMLKRDFVAAASVRKVQPPSWAVNHADEFGKPLPLKVEQLGPDRFLFDVTHVGAAFVCLSRECVEKMIEAYPDLHFDAAEGRTEYALFDPIIINRRRLSEDFAFCERWRAIGGHVWVDPAIDLKHVGVHVYSGSWLEGLAKNIAEERGAA